MAKHLIAYAIILSLIGISICCRNIKIIRKGLNCADKQAILDIHNKIRMDVATGKIRGMPPAINMLEMTWNNKLATIAQIWALDCKFLHDIRYQCIANRYYAGQNVGMTILNSSKPNPKNFKHKILTWFQEIKHFRNFNTELIPNAIKIIWADTYEVGCGYTVMLKRGKYIKLYICNYNPVGNIRKLPYTAGKNACNSKHVTNSDRYPGLCVSPNFKEFNCTFK